MSLTNLRTGGSLFQWVRRPRIGIGRALGIIILTALFAFEMFNYSTTDYALRDLLGDLRFIGIPWATILSIAFCGIDFAGIARLFTPEQGRDEPKEVWYLFGAWFLAATMNAILTWWGVSMAISTHEVRSTAVVNPATVTRIVPIFVAMMVWTIRILIIGTLSVNGERIFSDFKRPASSTTLNNNHRRPGMVPAASANASLRPASNLPTSRPVSPVAPRAAAPVESMSAGRPEPTYHSLSMHSSRPMAARPGAPEGSGKPTPRS